MLRRCVLLAAAVILAGTAGRADDTKPAAGNDRLTGKWTLPGEGQDAWEFHADGTVTGTTLGGLRLFLTDKDRPPGTWLTYTLGKTDGDTAAVEFTVRSVLMDETVAEGTFKAKVEFTKKGRMTVRYVERPADADRLARPFPAGKTLYRPEDLDD